MAKRQYDTATGKLKYNTTTGKLADNCNACDDCSNMPNFMDVAVSGTLTDSGCDECETVSNTWKLPFIGTTNCEWEVILCHCETLGRVEVKVDFLVEYRLSVLIEVGGDSVLYRALLGGSKPTCQFSSQSVPYVSGGGTACTGWAGLTVTVSAGIGPETAAQPCGHCNFDDTPDTLKATVKSTPVDDSCTDCDELEDTEVTLTRTGLVGDCCNWFGVYAGSDCTYDFTLSITDTKYTITIDEQGGSGTATWELTGLNDPFDCKASRTLSFVSDFGHCDFSGTTVDIAV